MRNITSIGETAPQGAVSPSRADRTSIDGAPRLIDIEVKMEIPDEVRAYRPSSHGERSFPRADRYVVILG